MPNPLHIPDKAWVSTTSREFSERRARLEDWVGASPEGELARAVLAPFDQMLFELFDAFVGREGERLHDRRCVPLDAVTNATDAHNTVFDLCADPQRVFLVSVDTIGLFRLRWDTYVSNFESGVPMVLAVGISEDRRSAFLSYYGEHFVFGATDMSQVTNIAKVARWRTPRDELVSKERLGIRYADGSLWESGRYGHDVERERMNALERALEWVTGLELEQHDLSPWHPMQ